MRLFYVIKILFHLIFLVSGSALLAQELDCANGIDDDQDGFIDCADSECAGQGTCSEAFICTNTLYQVISNSLMRLDPLSGTYELVGKASNNYNGAGYNVQDGYIYGIRSALDGIHLWKINASGLVEDKGLIYQFSGRTYVGDFDENGNLYTYQSGSSAYLSYVDVDAEVLESKRLSITNLSKNTPAAADITYNPVFKKFYGLDARNILFVLDPVALTSEIIGDFSEDIDVTGSYGAAWSDVEGASYFSNNKTGKIYKFDFDSVGEVTSVTHVSTGQPTNSNDGMGCFYSLPPFETSCNDGLDNDGDGFVDCADPDCATTGFCPRIDFDLRSLDIAGPKSIVPIHITFINSSQIAASDYSFELQMPDGFSFLADTLEMLGSSTFDVVDVPTEGEGGNLSWNSLNLPVGDTIILSMSLLVDADIESGIYNFEASCLGVLSTPISFVHELVIDESIFYNPAPYSCEPSFYQVYKKRGEPNVFGKLNPDNGTYEQLSIIDPQANGLGYDVNSGFAYGSDGQKFIRLDKDGNVAYLDLDFENKVFVGDVDTLDHWVGKVGSDLVVVDLNKIELIETRVNQGMPGWDMAYNRDGNFYAVHKDILYMHDAETKLSREVGVLLGDAIPKSGHGAQWTGADGYHYISNNASGQIYRIDIETREATLCMVAEPGLQFNDGFACPLEIAPVFSYDYGDLEVFPVARQLVYQQDIAEDEVPDYKMVWLGDRVTEETLDPSNSEATGDSGDDGVGVPIITQSGDELQFDLKVSSNTENLDAYWGIWVDWDLDGNYESFRGGSSIISDIATIQAHVEIPQNYASNLYGVRTRVSLGALSEELFSGDVFEPGEVEDYIFSFSNEEQCSNGIDDDQNGLIDCEDPICIDVCDFGKTTTGEKGGLESNGNLISRISESMFRKKRFTRSGQKKLEMFVPRENQSKSNQLSLDGLIPYEAIPNSEVYVSTPDHLVGITNATELLSVDVYQRDKRVAVALLLNTEDRVYEHTKYVCDRLSGASIDDMFRFKIDGVHEFTIIKIRTVEGDVEYSTSFSFRTSDDDGLVVESHWGLGSYPDSTSYTNVQLWANSTNFLIAMCQSVLDQAQSYSDIVDYKIGLMPEVFVKSGKVIRDSLELVFSNKHGLEYLNGAGYVSYSETSEQEEFDIRFDLSGASEQLIKLPMNFAYYIGITFFHESISTPDMIFIAEGAWGYNLDGNNEAVESFDILPGGSLGEDRFRVNRSLQMSGEVRDYISIFRSFTPRFEGVDLERFEGLSFKAAGNATLEIVPVKAGVQDWANQAKFIIDLEEEEQYFVLEKDFFLNNKGQSATWEDLNMIVINVLGDKESSQEFNISLSDLSFGWNVDEAPYLVKTEMGIVGPLSHDHVASIYDGTLIDSVVIKAGVQDQSINLNVQNRSSSVLYVEDIYIDSHTGEFTVKDFVPQELRDGDVYTITVGYQPVTWPSQSIANVTLYLSTDDGLEEVEVQLKGRSSCVDQDHINSKDLANGRDLFKAKSTISANANTGIVDILTLMAGQNIDILPGFEVPSNNEILLITSDGCQE